MKIHAILALALIFGGQQWPLNPSKHPPTAAELDQNYPVIEGWSGQEFQAATVAWQAHVSGQTRLTPEQRKVTNYSICVIDRGSFYHVHLIPKPDRPIKPGVLISAGYSRLGVGAFIIVDKKRMAVKYNLAGGA